MMGRSIITRVAFMKLQPAVVALALSLLASACSAPSPGVAPAAGPAADAAAVFVAALRPTQGNSAAGTVWLAQEGPQVVLRGRIGGLKADQQHGFHVHEFGDCSSADATSAGGHLNPGSKPHGPPDAAHHAGDLPALRADAAGNAEVRMKVEGTLLGSGAADIAGKALVVHAAPDDYTTQPTGNSGARIACGVISTRPGRDVEGKPITMPKDL